jgi:hypothetical protein
MPTTTSFSSDGFVYEYTSLKVRDSRRIQVILAKVLAPVFSDTPDFAAAVSALSEPDLDAITAVFGAACTFTGHDGHNYRVDKALDVHFSGRPLAYWQWLAECARVEFADFFAGLRALVGKVRADVQTPTA